MHTRSLTVVTLTLIAVAFLACLPTVALAETQSSAPGADQSQSSAPGATNPQTSLINPLNTGGNCSSVGVGVCLTNFLNSILALVIRIGSIAVILMLIYVGFLFVTAQGKEAEITKARQALLWTIVGALILLGAQAISLGISATVQAIANGQ